MVRVKCELSEAQSIEDGLLVSAYKSKIEDELVYIFTNLSKNTIAIDLGFSRQIRAYTTNKNGSLKFSRQSATNVTIPERSVVTVVN